MKPYRSVKVVLQNSTNERLTVQGLALLRGTWTDKFAPKQGEELPEQSAATWSSESLELGAGVSGFLRLGSVRGYTQLNWSLPWVGRFEFRVDSPEGLRAEVVADERQPDAVVVAVALHEARRAGEPEHARQLAPT
ncbi:MAG: hypothetical protein IRZ16_20060 [Myxococcaceae bacterium]|nr:hypothetical protein [Myxococcaceae bacterium]